MNNEKVIENMSMLITSLDDENQKLKEAYLILQVEYLTFRNEYDNTLNAFKALLIECEKTKNEYEEAIASAKESQAKYDSALQEIQDLKVKYEKNLKQFIKQL